MSFVPRFDGDVDRDAFRRHIEEEAPVRYLEDVGTELPKPACHAPENPRPVAGSDPEGGDPVFALELADHHGGEEPRIDISSAQDQADLLSLEPFRLREQR